LSIKQGVRSGVPGEGKTRGEKEGKRNQQKGRCRRVPVGRESLGTDRACSYPRGGWKKKKKYLKQEIEKSFRAAEKFRNCRGEGHGVVKKMGLKKCCWKGKKESQSGDRVEKERYPGKRTGNTWKERGVARKPP